eukprot:SAG31_NODE_1791_length_7258_cov_12.040928_5_plen_103_part_00
MLQVNGMKGSILEELCSWYLAVVFVSRKGCANCVPANLWTQDIVKRKTTAISMFETSRRHVTQHELHRKRREQFKERMRSALHEQDGYIVCGDMTDDAMVRS